MNGKIYVFGSNVGTTMHTAEAFDLETQHWRIISNMPDKSCHVSCAGYEPDIYIVGYNITYVL